VRRTKKAVISQDSSRKTDRAPGMTLA